MTKNSSSKKKHDAAAVYRSLIDAAVQQARDPDTATRVQKERIYSRAHAHRRFNSFIRTLSAEQRKLLADMLREERVGAIHDLLAHWTWLISCKGLAFTLNKKPMPVDLSGMGLHGDFIGRLDDWEWPEDET